MKDSNPFENQYIQHLQLFFYLVPVVGFFPAMWTLYQRQGNREQKTVSRLSVTLALTWLSGQVLLSFGAQGTDFLTMRLLFINSLLTSGYFLISFWLMVLVWQRKSLRLPGISSFAERVVGKHLS
ncbi:MAG: hypothetical protein NVS2B14_13930 [Chamaesiphon sp.]